MANVRTWPVRKIPRPSPTLHWAGSPVDFASASSFNRRQDDGEDTKEGGTPEPDNLSIHIQTQVDKLRAEGYTGKGIRVLVVDTGVCCSQLSISIVFVFADLFRPLLM